MLRNPLIWIVVSGFLAFVAGLTTESLSALLIAGAIFGLGGAAIATDLLGTAERVDLYTRTGDRASLQQVRLNGVLLSWIGVVLIILALVAGVVLPGL